MSKATITEQDGFYGVEYVVERESFATETHNTLERARQRAAWMDSMAGELDSLDLTPRDGDPAAPTPTMPHRALTAAENADAKRRQAAFDAAEIDA